MDDSVIAAIARWPNVPHVYGWLSLDRRGRWRLKGSPINNRHVADFIGRNYAFDENGAWFFQNGPQRVYVKLDYAPWVLHIDETRALLTHTRQTLRNPSAVSLDESGNLLIESEYGIGLVDDRDLPMLIDSIYDASGTPVDDAVFAQMMSGVAAAAGSEPALHWRGHRLPLKPVASSEIPLRYGFIADPQPARQAV